MNLWDMLGLSPREGLLLAAAGLAMACAWAAAVVLRRSRAERRSGLGLHDR